MARPLRLDAPGAFFHCMARGVEQREIFIDDQDRQLFVRLLIEAGGRFGLLVHAFALMNNHPHLLLESLRGELSKGMGWLLGTYSARFNYRHRRSGHLFGDRFKSLLIQDERYFLAVSRYIHLNPVAAMLCCQPWEYRWSSCRSLIGLDPIPSWLEHEKTFAICGGAEGYKELMNATSAFDPELQAVGRAVLGDRSFAATFLTETILQDPNIANRRDLGRRWSREELLSALAAVGLGVDDPRVGRKSRSFERGLAMFLLRDLGRLTAEEVGEIFGVGRSAVSMRVAQVRSRLEGDTELQVKVRELAERLGVN